MFVQNFSFQVSPEMGLVSATYMLPENSTCIMTLAHGAGAGMNHSFLVGLAEALAAQQIATLRFNFPFMENKKKRVDSPAVAHQTVASAKQHIKANYATLPLYLSGKSFGGRMSSQFLALYPDPEVEGIVFYGFPLHPAKKPSTDRAEHLKEVKQPMLFLQGTKDELADCKLIESVCASLPRARLIALEGADHAFKKGKENLLPALARQTREWINTIESRDTAGGE